MRQTTWRVFILVLTGWCVVAAAPPPQSGATASTGPRLSEQTVQDSVYGRLRRIWVYTPSGYDARRVTPYPIVVAFDGDSYRGDTMPLTRVLDTLQAEKKAPPFVAVLIDNGSGAERIADLGNATRMVAFLADQLLPWLRRGWHVTTDPHRVIITGSSAGGLEAAHAALTRPDLFGNVWSQSGAFWRGPEGSNDAPFEYLTTLVSSAPKRDVRFVLDVGALEDHATLGGNGPNFLEATRRFRDALKAKAYDVIYTEVPGGNHAEQWWAPRLGAGIAALCAAWH